MAMNMRSNHRHQEFFGGESSRFKTPFQPSVFATFTTLHHDSRSWRAVAMATAFRALLLAKYLTGALGGACTPVDSCPKLSDGLLEKHPAQRFVAFVVFEICFKRKKILLVPLGDFFGWFGRNISTFISKGFHPTKWMDLSFEKDPEMDHLYYDHQ